MRLVGAAHPGPAVAVTVLAGLLCLAWGVGVASTALVVAAVLTSQLSIGWSNDLVDLRRDVAVGRTDARHRRQMRQTTERHQPFDAERPVQRLPLRQIGERPRYVARRQARDRRAVPA